MRNFKKVLFFSLIVITLQSQIYLASAQMPPGGGTITPPPSGGSELPPMQPPSGEMEPPPQTDPCVENKCTLGCPEASDCELCPDNCRCWGCESTKCPRGEEGACSKDCNDCTCRRDDQDHQGHCTTVSKNSGKKSCYCVINCGY